MCNMWSTKHVAFHDGVIDIGFHAKFSFVKLTFD